MIRRAIFVLTLAAAAAYAGNCDERLPVAEKNEQTNLQAHELLDKLVGQWTLTGNIAGGDTTHDVDAAWVLHDKYVRITEVSRERDNDGRPAYEAIIFIGWSAASQRYVCFWFDNTDVASGEGNCLASFTHNAIPLEFRDARGALTFANTFLYDAEHETWRWQMDNVQGKTHLPFGRVSLRRK